MMFKTAYGTKKVTLQVNRYLNNKSLYIGLVVNNDGNPEPYVDLTVNLEGKPMNYHAYVDVNNMPDLVEFIREYDLGQFTGITKRSGFVEYPLFLFHTDGLRELDPSGVDVYERENGLI